MPAELRPLLLHLHKALVDSEREETALGEKLTPHRWWHMLSNDVRFAWLRPFTQLIAAMDEALEETLLDAAVLASLQAEDASLLREFGASATYQAALQHSPDAVMAHADALALLRRKIPPAGPP